MRAAGDEQALIQIPPQQAKMVLSLVTETASLGSATAQKE